MTWKPTNCVAGLCKRLVWRKFESRLRITTPVSKPGGEKEREFSKCLTQPTRIVCVVGSELSDSEGVGGSVVVWESAPTAKRPSVAVR